MKPSLLADDRYIRVELCPASSSAVILLTGAVRQSKTPLVAGLGWYLDKGAINLGKNIEVFCHYLHFVCVDN